MIRNISKRVTAGFTAVALVIAQVIMPAQTALAWSTTPPPNENGGGKSFICKMTGTPGVNEVLQTGDNPIARDYKSGDQVGTYFNDRQGGSYVVGFGAPGDKDEPSVRDCYAIVIPSVVVTAVPCVATHGTEAVTVKVANDDQVTGNTVIYSVTVDGQTKTTAALADGANQTLTFSGLAVGTYTVTVSALGGTVYTGSVTVASCTAPAGEEVPVPTPGTTDPCGLDNIHWNIAATGETTRYTWTTDANGTITYTAKSGYYFMVDGVQSQTATVYLPNDANVLCAPEAPAVQVFCGPENNDIAVLPEVDSDAHYHYVTDYNDATNTITVEAVADDGYSFAEGTQTIWRFVDTHTACSAPTFSPVDCKTPTGVVTVTYDTELYTYTISSTGSTGEVALESGVAHNVAPTGTYTVRAYLAGADGIDGASPLLDSWTHTYPALNCEPGRGNVTPPPATPVTPLPVELPHTGPTDAGSAKSLFLALIAALVTYGGVYFAQPRRS